VDGHVSAVTFDNSSCRVTGLVCRFSLAGYSGDGFAGYFTTGISEVSRLSDGSGYVCDWACFLTLTSDGHGAEQACPLDDLTCIRSGTLSNTASSTPSESALVMLADMSRVETNIKVVSVALADIVPDISIIRQTQHLSQSHRTKYPPATFPSQSCQTQML
jgi:hypothetical protein